MKDRKSMSSAVALIVGISFGSLSCINERSSYPSEIPTPTQVEDYSLTDSEFIGETSFFLSQESAAFYEPLPDFAFSVTGQALNTTPEGERMFPDEPGTVDDAIGAPQISVEVYAVSAENALIRAEPNYGSQVIAVLPRGSRIIGLAEGSWARIGKGQFVEKSALSADSHASHALQSRLLGSPQ